MSYLHCHNCDFSQDDFYNKNYNPFSKIWFDVKWLWKPEFIKFHERGLIAHISKYTHIPVFIGISKKGVESVFSWNWLLVEIVKDFKLWWKMKYPTYKSWQKAIKKNDGNWPRCPECDALELDID
jgi:hypothetical protein